MVGQGGGPLGGVTSGGGGKNRFADCFFFLVNCAGETIMGQNRWKFGEGRDEEEIL